MRPGKPSCTQQGQGQSRHSGPLQNTYSRGKKFHLRQRCGWLGKICVAQSIRTRVGAQILVMDKTTYRIVRAVAVLIVCCLAVAALFRYTGPPQRHRLLLAAIPLLLAVWFAYRNWRLLFGRLADSFRWNDRTVGVIALLILAIGVGLRFSLGRARLAFPCIPALMVVSAIVLSWRYSAKLPG